MNSQSETIGILLTNLGTPDSPGVSDVRRYLKEFLSDPRVVSVPRLIWWPLLNLVILNTRPKRSAGAYRKIWTEQGSPLLTISREQAMALQQVLDEDTQRYRVVLAMRYGSPSIAAGMEELRRQGISRIIVLPLYPQFSDTTTSSTQDAVDAVLRRYPEPPRIRVVRHYYEHPDYIAALADSVLEYWEQAGRADKLLFSFHGIPRSYAQAGDPYPDECRHTAELLADALALEEGQWQMSFQSRLGRQEWVRPYTDQTLLALAESGVGSVQVVCPGFSADCLETLEEIAMENRDLFLAAGGQRYEYIPCLNARPDHIAFLANLVKSYTEV